jgi:hypothetical protein
VKLQKTLNTVNPKIRFAIYLREDGLFRIDEEKHQTGDEYTGPYWSFDQIGIFGTSEDVGNFLENVAPKPTETWPS